MANQEEPKDLVSLTRNGNGNGHAIDYAEQIGLRSLGGGVLTSLDPSKPEDRKRIFAAVMGECSKAEDYINSELQATDILLSPASSTDVETGQVETWTRAVVLLSDGGRVSFGSQGVLKSLWLYSLCYGKPPWNPAAKFKLKSTSIGKNRWFTLEPIEETKPNAKSGK